MYIHIYLHISHIDQQNMSNVDIHRLSTTYQRYVSPTAPGIGELVVARRGDTG